MTSPLANVETENGRQPKKKQSQHRTVRIWVFLLRSFGALLCVADVLAERCRLSSAVCHMVLVASFVLRMDSAYACSAIFFNISIHIFSFISHIVSDSNHFLIFPGNP